MDRKSHPNDHHLAPKACRVMKNGDVEGRIFLFTTHINGRFFFLLHNSIPHFYIAVGWSAVCDCGISYSYSLTFSHKSLKLCSAYLIDLLFFIHLQDMLIVRR